MQIEKYFNTSGPCSPNEHYMLPAQERCKGLLRLINRKQYFVIHAARQSGKTTLLMELAHEINEAGHYYALYCSLEVAQNIIEPEEGIKAIINRLAIGINAHPNLQKVPFAVNVNYSNYATILFEELINFCKSLDKPLIILFDEVDCLSNGTLISFLRQLRDGYVSRVQGIPFPHSVALVGMRQIRDYKAKVREEKDTLGSASPFNIVTESLTLRNFTRQEMNRLYAQHTTQTNQQFSDEVLETIYYYSQGQPWLVNAIAREIIEKILDFDYSQTITIAQVEQAAETIIQRRDTHIDSLMQRLTEARVQKIVEPVILGEVTGATSLDDDYQYTLDLGLLRKMNGQLIPSNPIYAEVMTQTLTSGYRKEMDATDYPPYAPAYLVDGKLDMKRLLSDFQQFWRRNSEMWKERYQYKEAAPHLVLQAFLMRVVNGGGQVTREMAEGAGRLDLCVQYNQVEYPIELKIRRQEVVYNDGKDQLLGYMDKLGCEEGWLVVFDKRKKTAWDEKIFWKTEQENGKTIHIVGC